jgi:ribosomal protein L11 methyltransferase
VADTLLVLRLRAPAHLADALCELLATDDWQYAFEHAVDSPVAEVRFFSEDAAANDDLTQRLTAILPTWEEILGAPLELLSDPQLLAREDWAETWKRFFSTLRVSPRLVIKPSWEKAELQAHELLIELDPGMSFGTGRHATTAGCLRLLDQWTSEHTGPVLDVGTGSGILAIAALRLGCHPVRAYDFDPDAIRVATENLERNGLLPACELAVADVLQDPDTRHYQIVVANLMSELLIAAAPRLMARLQATGPVVLILAGILREQFAGVQAAYEAQGLRLVERLDQDEWSCGSFTR